MVLGLNTPTINLISSFKSHETWNKTSFSIALSIHIIEFQNCLGTFPFYHPTSISQLLHNIFLYWISKSTTGASCHVGLPTYENVPHNSTQGGGGPECRAGNWNRITWCLLSHGASGTWRALVQGSSCQSSESCLLQILSKIWIFPTHFDY